MAKTFEEMTKAELQKAISAYKLDDKVKEINENIDKVTNAQYIEILNKYKQEKNEQVKEEVKKETGTKKKPSISEMKALRAEDLYIKIPVIITDHDSTIDIKDDSDNRIEEVYWGNTVIGQTERFLVRSGETQYLTKGLVKKLKRMTIPEFVKDSNGREIVKSRKRFTIAPGEPMTDKKLEEMKKLPDIK